MKIAIIGAGNMAKAIIKALLQNRVASAEDITVSDVNLRSLELIQGDLGIKTSDSNLEAICPAEIIILAVKPQNLGDISRELCGKIQPGQLVISILAGTSLARLTDSLKHEKIIRAMPNTPAQISMGMTVWTASKHVTAEQKNDGQAILSALGKAIFTDDENCIDMATAISGSGPAYFFLFMEYLVESAVSLGFDDSTARELVLQTALGAIKYAISSDQELSALRRQVTSPGGTTAEAIACFNSQGLKETVRKAVVAAHRKAVDMGKS